MEIELTYDGICYYETARKARGKANVCANLLRDEIFLPKTVRKIYAVFTTKRAPDAFRIKPPNERGESGIAGVREYILSWTRKTLGKAYNDGYRYVRIEY